MKTGWMRVRETRVHWIQDSFFRYLAVVKGIVGFGVTTLLFTELRREISHFMKVSQYMVASSFRIVGSGRLKLLSQKKIKQRDVA